MNAQQRRTAKRKLIRVAEGLGLQNVRFFGPITGFSAWQLKDRVRRFKEARNGR